MRVRRRVRLVEDIKASVEDARRMKRTERVIVPLSPTLLFLPLHPFAFPSRPFIDNPRVLIRIPIFRFNTMFPAVPYFPPVLAPASSSQPLARLSPLSPCLRPAAALFSRPPSLRHLPSGLNGQTETFKLRAHKANEFCTRGHDSLELYCVVN